MPVVVADETAEGNPGCIPGKACHPSGTSCLASTRSIELCIDLTKSSYETGGFTLDAEHTALGCPLAMDCLAGPCDPWGTEYAPPPNMSLLLVKPEGEYDPVLKLFVDGEEAPDGYSAPEGTPCIWVRMYGLH